MKLLLLWLLGVPLLVTSMVMARSLSMDSEQLAKGNPAVRLCSRDLNPHDVAPLVTQQGQGVSCNHLAID